MYTISKSHPEPRGEGNAKIYEEHLVHGCTKEQFFGLFSEEVGMADDLDKTWYLDTWNVLTILERWIVCGILVLVQQKWKIVINNIILYMRSNGNMAG